MKKIEIVPYTSVGLIPFGIDRNELHKLIGMPSFTFKKMKTQLSDRYDDLALIVYYNNKDRVNAIEAWPDCNICFEEVKLFGQPYVSLLDFFKKFDQNLKVEKDGFTSLETGISFWYDGPIEDSTLCSSVFIFEKDYETV